MGTRDDDVLALIAARTEADVEDVANRALATATGADRAEFMQSRDADVVAAPCVPGHDRIPHQQRAVVERLIDTALAANERTVVDDLTDTRSATNPSRGDAPLYRSLLCEPVGEWGLLVAVDTDEAAFDRETQERVRRLAAGVTAALDRIQPADDGDSSDADLSAVVAHDLRNPLQVATARLEMVQQECDHEHLPTVAHSLDRMRELIDDLLVASTADRLPTELEDLDLPATVQSSWSNVRSPAATLENRTRGTIRADPTQLKRLLENLIGNAIEHAGETVTVTVGDLDDGFYLEDDGPGIPPAERAAVFEAGVSTERNGSGLGLAIAKRIVDTHGWDVTITDGTDGGARFEIRGIEPV